MNNETKEEMSNKKRIFFWKNIPKLETRVQAQA